MKHKLNCLLLKSILVILTVLGSVSKSFSQCNTYLNVGSTKSGVVIGDLDITGNQITLEATFNRTSAYDALFGGGNLVSKHQDPTNVNYLLRPNYAAVTTTNGYYQTPDICAISLNKTYHVAMVYNGSSLKFYRNGFLMSQINCAGNLVTNDLSTRIGAEAFISTIYTSDFLGFIDEVRIWNVARTQSQIQANMNNSLPTPTTQTGLQAYYSFNSLVNKQGNAAWNGTLFGTASTSQTNPTCTTFAADSCVNINSGLVAYYPFNGNAGDSSGNGNHPAFNNATLTADRFGNVNKAYKFNGTSSYMQVPNKTTLNPNNTISICSWVKVDGFYQGPCHGNWILGKGFQGANNYDLEFTDGPYTNGQNCSITLADTLHQQFSAWGYSVKPTDPYVQKNKWYYLTYTYDGAIAKLYINGSLISSNSSPGLSFNNTSDLFIGRYPTGAAALYWLNGVLDDIRIYNRAINASEVAALYMPAALTLNDGLMAYYPFNGNAGDSSGNGNHPSFNNATLTTDRFGNANKAYSFNGINNYMKINNSSSLNTGKSMSLCVWVKVKSFYKGHCHGNRIMYKGDIEGASGAYGIDYSDVAYTMGQNCSIVIPDTLHQNFYGLSVSAPNGGYTPYVQKDIWYFLAFTNDGGTGKLYINGTLALSSTTAPTTYTNIYDLYFGKLNNGSTPYWINADLDDIRFYSRAISATEISTLYTEGGTVLPVAFKSFTGQLVNNQAALQITTANEVNAASIVIERSYNGTLFNAITSMVPKNAVSNQYTFTDNTLAASITKVYYRLMLVNKDGTFTYSSIVAFDLKTAAGITLYPNPAKDFVQLQVKTTKEEKTDVKVLDISGKTVLTQQSRLVNGVTNISINNINTLTKGVYLIQLTVNNELVTKKLVIE